MAQDYAEVFREEAGELLEELENALLAMEQAPEDLKLVGRVFRAMHTIKGSGAMFGFDAVADFTHHVETVLDKVRNGLVPVTKELINLTLAARDHINSLLSGAAEDGKAQADEEQGRSIIAGLEKLVNPGSGSALSAPEAVETSPPPIATASKAEPEPDAGQLHHYIIHFEPGEAFFAEGGEVEQLLAELCKLGECSIISPNGGPETAKDIVPGCRCWDMLVTTNQGINAVKDIFIFAESTSRLTVTTVDESDWAEPSHKKLGEILVERGYVTEGDIHQALSQQKPLGEILVETQGVARDRINSALAEQKLLKKSRETKAAEKAGDSIRVAADKLDVLINLVGELVVTQARLTQISSRSGVNDFIEPVESVERLTAELRDCVLSIRMLPIGTTFARFQRLVRDLSAELGKEIEMVTEGAETELDKSVIEQLGEPLIHLIRNSIDHGIEAPAERLAAGKPERGTIRLAARHSGAHVVITVSDDGKGLDAEGLRAKGIKMGLIAPDAELSRTEIFNLIFGAGFSMAKAVTSVSGRGVGMDVVKSTIEGRLKGSVSVSSDQGRGTAIEIILPLTLAIIDGLLVVAGATHFVLPLTQVEECVEITSADIERYHGRRVFSVRDHLVPYVRLRDFFKLGYQRPEREQMVIVRQDGDRLGLVLDDVIGSHQTVIKSLGWAYRNAQGISGATILGTGEVALIVDVASLVKLARQEENKMVTAVH